MSSCESVYHFRYPLDLLPGWTGESVGYHTSSGKLYKGRPRGQPFGPKCQVGDRVGCGVKFDAVAKNSGLSASMVPVFFTKNGKEIGTQLIPSPPGGLYPAVGLQREPEEIMLSLESRWSPEEDIAMAIDCGEEDWRRLHDIRLNGQVLEYIGRGKSLMDVGLAQARTPLSTRTHYFEIEIMDPGSNCYIAIGLARKDYPRDRHPGWNKGSIAYHADDGKVVLKAKEWIWIRVIVVLFRCLWVVGQVTPLDPSAVKVTPWVVVFCFPVTLSVNQTVKLRQMRRVSWWPGCWRIRWGRWRSMRQTVGRRMTGGDSLMPR